MASVEHEGLLMPKACRTKLFPSEGTSQNTSNGRKYDDTEDDNDEEGMKNPYRNVDINEETTLDIPISELPNVIEEKKEKGDEGFKKEYVVREEALFIMIFRLCTQQLL